MIERLRSDHGASIFMLAISLFLLIGASAIAVDIAAIWLDRSTDQKVTDAAAAVGVIEAMRQGGQPACETALDYVATNTADIDSIDTSGCTAFSDLCVEGADRDLTVSAGRYDLTLVYPVTHDHDLMTSGIVGRPDQDPHVDDGDKDCQRVGVRMASTRNSMFASVLGFDQGATTVHTVARRTDGDLRPPFNLLVLDRTGCPAIDVGGGGGIIADAVIAVDDDGVPTGLVPGIIAADSDGSVGCSSKGVINVSGGGSLIRSDGEAECPSWTGDTYDKGGFDAYEGCGKISVYAPGTPGCNMPACSISGGENLPVPPPTPLGERYTRKVADYTYNCYADYTNPPLDVLWASPALLGADEQYIDPCEEADGTNDYIYKLIQEVGKAPTTAASPDIFTRWTDLGHTCSPIATGNTVVVPHSVVVDCNGLTINGTLEINGNAVFNGNISVKGSLTVNPPTGDDWNWIFFRGGLLDKAGSGEVAFNNAMVYMSQASGVKLTGGDGALVWTAPLDGRFKSLALWSDSPDDHKWSGQANLTMKGIFFMPWAEAAYSGNGDMQQTEAQWIAWRVSAQGNGALRIAPPLGGGLTFPDHMTILIR